jgi:hypothetical protein
MIGLSHLWPQENLYRSTFMMSGTPSLAIQNSSGLIDTRAKPAWTAMISAIGCSNAPDTVDCLRGVNATELLEIQTELENTFPP